MPVVKPKSVHETPERLIKYILDPDKNEKMKSEEKPSRPERMQ